MLYSSVSRRYWLAILLVSSLFLIPAKTYPKKIYGRIVDNTTGEELAGVNVVLQGFTLGSSTDLDGNFIINNVKPGSYILHASILGYASIDQKIVVNDDIRIQIRLSPTTIQLKEVVVKGKAAEGSEERELSERRESVSIEDVVSGERMKKMPDPDVSEVIRHVTGVTSMDGNPIIRGLDQRYSKVTLNTAMISGTEPNRSAVSLDLFPSKMMSSVTIKKSYTADQFGEFGGGNVNMDTWGALGSKELNVGASTSFNTSTTFKSFLTYDGGSLDFLTFDDGTRKLPITISKENKKIVEGGMFSTNGLSLPELEKLSESFKNNWNTKSIQALPNQDYRASLSGSGNLFNRQINYIVSGLYKNSYQYKLSERNVYKGDSRSEITLQHSYIFQDYIKSVDLGGMTVVNHKLSPLSRINLNVLYNRNLEDNTRYYYGWNDDRAKNIRDTRLRFVVQSTLTTQLSGDQALPNIINSNIDWSGTYSYGTRQEPDTREVQWEADPGKTFVLADESQSGSRIFNDLQDHTLDGSFNWTFRPKGNNRNLNFKVGLSALRRWRDSETRFFLFEPRNGNTVNIEQDAESIFSASNLGANGFLVREATRPTDSYKASQVVNATYLMSVMQLTPRIKTDVGIRLEQSHQEVQSYELYTASSTPVVADINTVDILPALNLNYTLKRDMSLKLGMSRTVSRPDFRELSQFEFTDIIGGFAVVGNPHLKQSLISNYDIRWEWIYDSLNLLAISVFYKYFENPIEVILEATAQNRISYDNALSAQNLGVEFEIRQNLGSLIPVLIPFRTSANLALIKSNAEFSDSSRGIQTNNNRPLHGQSPYLLNLNLDYTDRKYATYAGIYLHVFGKRIAQVGARPLPDVYEMPHPALDLMIQQPLKHNLNLKASLQNVLNPEIRFEQDGHPTEKYKTGRVFSLGISFKN